MIFCRPRTSAAPFSDFHGFHHLRCLRAWTCQRLSMDFEPPRQLPSDFETTLRVQGHGCPRKDPLLQAGSECMHHEWANPLNYVKILESIIPHVSRFCKKTRILRTKDASSNRGKAGNSFTRKPRTKSLHRIHIDFSEKAAKIQKTN